MKKIAVSLLALAIILSSGCVEKENSSSMVEETTYVESISETNMISIPDKKLSREEIEKQATYTANGGASYTIDCINKDGSLLFYEFLPSEETSENNALSILNFCYSLEQMKNEFSNMDNLTSIFVEWRLDNSDEEIIAYYLMSSDGISLKNYLPPVYIHDDYKQYQGKQISDIILDRYDITAE